MNPHLPRKRRTREHVIACMSTNHVEQHIYDVGYTAERVENDYGYDLILFTYDNQGYVEQGCIFIQLKASEHLHSNPPNGEYKYRISIEDYNLWQNEPMPVFLILYDAEKRKGFWLYVQAFFEEDQKRRPRKNAQSIQVNIPVINRINRRTIKLMRKSKEIVLMQLDRVISHHV